MFKIVNFLAMGASKCNLFIAKKKEKTNNNKKTEPTKSDIHRLFKLCSAFAMFRCVLVLSSSFAV